MIDESVLIVSRGWENIAAVFPAVLGALLILLIGWIAGRLLGKAVRLVLDRAVAEPAIGDSDIGRTVKTSGISAGYIGDMIVRCIVYLVAILAAVDILNMEYLSQLMTKVIEYIPHVIAFIVILVAGIRLIDYFIDTFGTYSDNSRIELMNPVLVLLRIFLYFVVVTLALSQLMLDLTIIYTIVTPVAWGISLGFGASIAIVVWFGMKHKSEEIMNRVMEVIAR